MVLALFFGLGFGGCNGGKFETDFGCDSFEESNEENFECNLYQFDHVKVWYNLIFKNIYMALFLFLGMFLILEPNQKVT
jgi:hypothetical protein